jgi:hypothetical protein
MRVSAKKVKICNKLDYLPGTSLPYGCPEFFYRISNENEYNEKCDVFSVGMIMLEILIRRSIFEMPRNKIQKLY